MSRDITTEVLDALDDDVVYPFFAVDLDFSSGSLYMWSGYGDLVIDGCSPSVTGFLLPGDYIQLGSSTTTQLYKVLTQVDTDASGGATLDLWPNLRSSPADNSTIIVANTKGRFRLKDNVTQWGINEISSYGITFDCVEAL